MTSAGGPSGRGAAEAATAVHTVVFDAGMTLLRPEPSFAAIFAEGCAAAGVDVSGLETAPSETGWTTAPTSGSSEGDPTVPRRRWHRSPGSHIDRDWFGNLAAGVWDAHLAAWEEAGGSSPHIGDPDAERAFWTGLYRRYLDALDVPGDHDEIASCVWETFSRPDAFGLYEDVEPVLGELRRRGLRLALLSNWGPSLRQILRHHELEDRFDAVVISGEVGVAKPDTEIFSRLLAALDLEPQRAVAYVGDDPHHDIVPARRIGLSAVLIDRHGRHPGHEGRRVGDLAALSEMLAVPVETGPQPR